MKITNDDMAAMLSRHSAVTLFWFNNDGTPKEGIITEDDIRDSCSCLLLKDGSRCYYRLLNPQWQMTPSALKEELAEKWFDPDIDLYPENPVFTDREAFKDWLYDDYEEMWNVDMILTIAPMTEEETERFIDDVMDIVRINYEKYQDENAELKCQE